MVSHKHFFFAFVLVFFCTHDYYIDLKKRESQDCHISKMESQADEMCSRTNLPTNSH